MVSLWTILTVDLIFEKIMKQSTVVFLVLVTTVYHNQVSWMVDAQRTTFYSPPRPIRVHRKGMFSPRKCDGKKAKYLRLPIGEQFQLQRSKRVRRQSGVNWQRQVPYAFGQPPLNPTGPPPGAFSPGSPFAFFNSPERRRQISAKHNYMAKPRPTRTPGNAHSKTRCPYKLLVEQMVESNQKRLDGMRKNPLTAANNTEISEMTLPSSITSKYLPTSRPQVTPVNPVEVALNARLIEVLSVLLKKYVSGAEER